MIDLTNKRFNRLVVVVDRGKKIDCICDCGSSVTKIRYDVIRGFIKSCGCLHRDKVIARNKATAKRDGLTHTYTGRSWSAMMSRCYNAKYHDYAAYGGVGIIACEFIKATPLNLLLLIGERPISHSIDRVNNFGSYTCGQCSECLINNWPLNVRWASATQQGRNQKTNRMITIRDKTMCLADWSDHSGIPYSTLIARIARGWAGEKLISPLLSQGRPKKC